MSSITAMLSATATSSAAPASTGGNRVPSQGGVIEGANPSHYNPKDPITMFIIQAGLIIIVCHLLHWPLSKIRQPRVIAEVIGGIVLGPSVLGRIPGFRAAIFPTESIPNLTLVANLGLVLYLFLIGLETDVRFLVSNWRVATSVAFAGLALPFAFGCALAWGLYNQFSSDEGVTHIDFPIYMLFIGVAIAITAFPVLCRILTELKLLDTSVGVIVLSAGVANDVVGWILLALCVALANAGTGLSALWILLACVGYMLFLLYLVRPALLWLLRRTGNIENGPSQSMIALILLIALTSAFFTGIIGVHAIFGGFMVGLILPRENGFAIKVTEKLEDLIGALFLPLYFTLSGLNTNLGLLDSGITWGYVIAVTFTAFLTKVIGASLAARLNGLVWRESFSIGALMSCKGLVELIVLVSTLGVLSEESSMTRWIRRWKLIEAQNIGLQARILSTRTFTIFVVMALLTTFATTPLTSFLYPRWYQKKLEAWKRGEIDWDTGEPIASHSGSTDDYEFAKPTNDRVQRLLVYLRLDNMPALLNLVSLFGKQSDSGDHYTQNDEKAGVKSDTVALGSSNGIRAVRAHGFRLLHLTDRDSSVMTVSQVDDFSRNDPVVNIFRTVGQFVKVAVSGEVSIMPETRFAEALLSKSSDISSDLLLVPWSASGSLVDTQVLSADSINKLGSTYTGFAKSILDSPEHNIGIFFPKGSVPQPASDLSSDRNKLSRAYSFSDIHHDIPTIPVTNKSHQVFMPYFGGNDDKLALKLVLQLCEKHNAQATVVHFTGTAEGESQSHESDYFGFVSTHTPASVVSRIKFETSSSANVLEAASSYAASGVRADTREVTWHNLVILGRRSAIKATEGKASVRVSEDIQDCLGLAAGVFITAGVKADLLVVQAKTSST
ncbi:sodium/hydrogen exchanger family protein [Colletotrichum orchidophilum]|uniref:Sodium/hydrogen exchanger family protein n=1 Tax=Colletotrichum orchidophilum TaxID=1209926 RepID=A0A1G4BPI0_9PEZI|nr:sodium/hydrogen exchanger family protein [Colletotrichum orchidophilum]OHF03371.1 sodium/hydrogen exchanger family protein [Colletotrichum orchidophilum]